MGGLFRFNCQSPRLGVKVVRVERRPVSGIRTMQQCRGEVREEGQDYE